MVGELGDDHLGKESRAGESPLRRADEVRAMSCLDVILAAPAGVLGPEMDILVEIREPELKATSLLMADGDSILSAAGADALGLREVVDRDLGGEFGGDLPAAGMGAAREGSGSRRRAR